MASTVMAMAWYSEDGRHEAYLVAQFRDGQQAAGVWGAGIPAGRVAVGRPSTVSGTSTYETRPAEEVIGWVLTCDCYDGDSFGLTNRWVGPVFTRVSSQPLHDPSALRIFAADEDVEFVSDGDEISVAARALWNAFHVLKI